MSKNDKIHFKILHLDSLCQGVSKSFEGHTRYPIVFIGKVLPGEEGEASVYATKKSIAFAKLDKVNKPSPLRITSECPHFSECGGCQMLHTSYENELEIKRQAMLDIFQRQQKIELTDKVIQVKAPERFNYRNRVQLQYDRSKNKLGFFNDDNSQIVNIENCKIYRSELRENFKSLYENNAWQKLAKKDKGHVEIYLKNDQVKTTWDERYAHEGFSQVNEYMNNEMLKIVQNHSQEFNKTDVTCIDLFGGNGNLSKHLQCQSLVIDATYKKYIKLQNDQQEYFELDLFNDKSPIIFQKIINSKAKEKRFLIVDPPRSGLKNIDEYVKNLNASRIIYVSCNPQTLARDLKPLLENYKLTHLYQLDFFPGTKHFESIAILDKQ